MTEARRSHEQKTTEERRRYYQANIDRKEAPTADVKTLLVDSTEAISVDEEELTGPSARPAPILRESALTRFLRDKGFELFLSVAAGVLLAVVSWLAVQVYSMNRELGELRVRQERSGQDAEKAQQEAARALEKAEERFQRALDRLETRAAAPQPAAATARP